MPPSRPVKMPAGKGGHFQLLFIFLQWQMFFIFGGYPPSGFSWLRVFSFPHSYRCLTEKESCRLWAPAAWAAGRNSDSPLRNDGGDDGDRIRNYHPVRRSHCRCCHCCRSHSRIHCRCCRSHCHNRSHCRRYRCHCHRYSSTVKSITIEYS